MSIAHSPPENTAIFNAVNESAIGIDVHADLYVAVYQQCSFGAKNVVGHRKFTKGATKADIDELARWCVNLHPQVILMESTGVYWQALYEGLERAGFNQSNIAVVNARDVKNKKGSKTDFNCDINRFIDGFKKLHETVKGTKSPEKGIGTILFYGPPGTGKTELGHYLAKLTRRKVVIKKASDLLNCYVGMSEKLVAETFNNLDIKKEILIIDEVDSFLYDRAGANHSWEKTLVNEFLTQLQEFRGILICTTNLVKGLDPAVMRRFTTKLEFKYSEGKQCNKSIICPT